jgi:hypothetical protein
MAPERTRLGDRGPHVADGQARLLRECAMQGRPELDPGPVDGVHGPRTEAAWLAYESPTVPPTLRTGAGVRERMVAIVEATVGLHQGRDRVRWLDLLAGPGDGPAQRQMFASWSTSSCALVARGWLRQLGVRHLVLEQAYVTGAAMRDLETIGRDLGAWVVPRVGLMPLPGDVVVLDSSSGGHAYCAVKVDGPTIESVDGGQHEGPRLGDGPQFIARMRRRWAWERGRMRDYGVTTRPVRGWVDVGLARG